jgi:hypothetical protein
MRDLRNGLKWRFALWRDEARADSVYLAASEGRVWFADEDAPRDLKDEAERAALSRAAKVEIESVWSSRGFSYFPTWDVREPATTA